jgi:predicted transcriptional regulator
MTRLEPEARMTIKALVARGTSHAAVARLLGVSEGAVRYHLARMAAGAVDGRGTKPFKATAVAGAIEHWREAQVDGAIN